MAIIAAFGFSVTPVSKSIDVSKSTITWTGKKVTGKHYGTINIKVEAAKLKEKYE